MRTGLSCVRCLVQSHYISQNTLLMSLKTKTGWFPNAGTGRWSMGTRYVAVSSWLVPPLTMVLGRPGVYRVFSCCRQRCPLRRSWPRQAFLTQKMCSFSNFHPGFQLARAHSFECLMWQRISLALRQRFSTFAFVFTLVRDRLVVGRLTSYSPFSGISSMPAAPLLPANLASMSPSFRRPLGIRLALCWKCLTNVPGPPFRILQGRRL